MYCIKMQGIADGFASIVGENGEVTVSDKGCVIIKYGVLDASGNRKHSYKLYQDITDQTKYFILDSQGLFNAVAHPLWYWNESLISIFKPRN